MKKIFVLLAISVLSVVSAQAQRVQTVDKAGEPIPYASIIGEDGKFIGTTDLNGVLDDVKGAEVVSITHVAYKSKKVKVGKGGTVALKDADFGLPEITVTKKPLVYAQIYYRIYYLSDNPDYPCVYYRAGLINNSYERQTKKLSKDEDHFSACNRGVVKTALNLFLGAYIKDLAGLTMGKFENRIKKRYPELGVTITPDGPGKKRISDKYGEIGYIADNHDKSERRFSYDAHVWRKHHLEATANDKKMAKAKKKEARQKNRTDQDFMVYRIDDQGNYLPEDFVMMQSNTSYDDADDGGHVVILVHTFTTDRAYVTKDELKRLKKEKKMKISYQSMAEFERQHNIPALPAEMQKRIKEIVK